MAMSHERPEPNVSSCTSPLSPMQDPKIGRCTNRDVNLTLSDLYQVTMSYAFWKVGSHEHEAVFDVFFRTCPFQGEFCVFAGLHDVLRFVNTCGFSDEEIEYLKNQVPHAEEEFWIWLQTVNGSRITIHAVPEGSFIFPRCPVLRVEGPLAICQLLETPILNLVNFPSLIATNAVRFRLAAGWDKKLFEFGTRRAQGPDGAMSASRYSYLGSFDGSSNILAGLQFGIPIQGTHAHSFVSAFTGLDDLPTRSLTFQKVKCDDFVGLVLDVRKRLLDTKQIPFQEVMNEGEFTAFIAFAQAFPNKFVCLVDTFDTIASGCPNFLCVAYALHTIGFAPLGIRLDSGDLAYLSKQCRAMFRDFAKEFQVPHFANLKIMASNDINESVLSSLNDQDHEIDMFGIGTHLVTCQAQPALGMVYKLVEVTGRPTMKVSEDICKTTFPFKKAIYRLYGQTDRPILDLVQKADEPPPTIKERVECRHMLVDRKRCYVIPNKVEPLLSLLWLNGTFVANVEDLGLEASRSRCKAQINSFRADHLRTVYPTPYKVSASASYYNLFRELWQERVPMFTID